MKNRTITDLVKLEPLLNSTDTVRRAAGLIRASSGSSLAVRNNNGICGMVSEQAITAFLGASDNIDQALDQPIDNIIEEYPVLINSSVTLKEAAQIFASSGADTLPVIDSYGSFRGLVHRRDLIDILAHNLRPPSVAGMATPLGVYLTTGTVSGGAGSLGLFLTGVSLALMMIVSSLAAEGLMRLFGKVLRVNIIAYLASTPLRSAFNVYDIPNYLMIIFATVIFMLLMRLLPLSGYHAAEHMTVHTIEAGEELSPEIVRRMPRVHPRCGTNLLVAASVFILITSKFGGQIAALIAIMIVVLGWRWMGGWLQYMVTTKPPTEKQLKNGITAGKQLLEHFQEQPQKQVDQFTRIWNMGMLQTAAGMIAVLSILYLLQPYLKLPGF